MCQQRISFSESERDLGLIVKSNLNRDEHVGKDVKKANQVLRLISRAYQNKSQNNLIPLYKSLVQPHLEYAVQLWSPYKQNYIENIERVQRRTTRMIEGVQYDPYHGRLKKENWPDFP